jgi:hypothetical protein
MLGMQCGTPAILQGLLKIVNKFNAINYSGGTGFHVQHEGVDATHSYHVASYPGCRDFGSKKG